jgi:pimeloyl-ACP methyl ester carboxylesterase
MPFLTNDKSQPEVDIFFEDYGSGQPVILIHGWPLSHRAWEAQVPAIVDAGYRCISYDRRGFGLSSMPWGPYDYSTLTGDLHALITELDLKDVILVGFSMGGGEVVRYLTDHGSDRIAKAVLISSIIPLVPQQDDNPDGVPADELEGIMEALQDDRVGFLAEFLENFYNYDDTAESVSDEHIHYDWTVAAYASPRATLKTAEAWAGTDFRSELKNVTVPTLIIHGDDDNIVPIETAGAQAAKGIKNNEYHVIKGGPHGLTVTHREKVNQLLIDFLNK